jgi:hypothetical protein
MYYNNLEFEMTFSGNFLLVKNFLREGYLHMGFQDPLAYSKVIELQFKKGLLKKEVDLSTYIEQLHEQRIFSTKRIPQEIREKVGHWLDSRKKLNY